MKIYTYLSRFIRKTARNLTAYLYTASFYPPSVMTVCHLFSPFRVFCSPFRQSKPKTMDLGKRKTPDLSTKRFFWLRSQIPIQIAKPVRENSLQFYECNCFGAFVEIVGQHHLVIIQENGVNKRINQHLALRFPGDVHLSEPFKEKAELFFGNPRLCQFLAGDLVLQFILCGLQSIQPFLG